MDRVIRTHHDGHGLAESMVIMADGEGPGGGSHRYQVLMDTPGGEAVAVATIQFQCGPRGVPGSVPGIIDSVLLAIVADRMVAFNAGPYPSRETALVRTKCEEAMHWLRHRADERAARGVLGQEKK